MGERVVVLAAPVSHQCFWSPRKREGGTHPCPAATQGVDPNTVRAGSKMKWKREDAIWQQIRCVRVAAAGGAHFHLRSVCEEKPVCCTHTRLVRPC